MSNILPKRKSPRAQWIEYNTGLYFITVCTHNWIHYFGEIKSQTLQLNEIGEFVSKVLAETSMHNPYIEVLQYVVMPNHFHAIVEISAHNENKADTACCVPTADERILNGIKGDRPLLSIFVGSIKSAVTRYAHNINKSFKWQGRYHDHLIRGVKDCNNISEYIENNVLNWEKDCFYEK